MPYYKITICPDPMRFPNGISEAQLAGLKTYWGTHEEALLSTEHHQSGVVHYEGLFSSDVELRTANLKRSLFSLLGVDKNEYVSMSPSMKKHMIVIRAVNYLPGAIAYVMKEGSGDLVKKGMTDTWISEQVIEAEKNKQIVDAKSVIYVNDSTFIKEVTTWMVENEKPWALLREGLVSMQKTHNFARVKAGKHHVAHLMAKHCDDMRNAEWLVADWFAPEYRC